jgi:hypothetical protein
MPWPAATGHLDCYNNPVTVLGHTAQHWIRSSYFFVRPAEVKSAVSLPGLTSFAGCRRVRPRRRSRLRSQGSRLQRSQERLSCERSESCEAGEARRVLPRAKGAVQRGAKPAESGGAAQRSNPDTISP